MEQEQVVIHTVETRRFTSTSFVAPIEVEFYKNPGWSDDLYLVRDAPVEGAVLARLAARAAVTGSVLPPFLVYEIPGVPILLNDRDILDLAITIGSVSSFPIKEDHSEGSSYRLLREKIESSLGVQHTHLALRSGRYREAEEAKIALVASQLSNYSIAISNSPGLNIDSFIKLLSNNRRLFGFRSGANMLLGTSALASAYQLAMLANPILAIEIAAAGATSYVLLKFGAAVGKKIEGLFSR